MMTRENFRKKSSGSTYPSFSIPQLVTAVSQTFVEMAQSVLSMTMDSSVFVPLDTRAHSVMVRISAC